MGDDIVVLATRENMELQVRLYLKAEDLGPVPRGRKSHRGKVVRFAGREFAGVFKVTSVLCSRFPGFFRVTLRPVDG